MNRLDLQLMPILMHLPNHVVLSSAFTFMALVLVGGIVRREASPTGGMLLRGIGNFGLTIALAITLLQLTGMVLNTPALASLAVTSAMHRTSALQGNETRIPLADDGHFWVDAAINGVNQRFLIDTGATYTTISSALAREAMIEAQADSDVSLHTANGETEASFGVIRDLKVGLLSTRSMRAIIAPDMGTTNVLGMNFLNSLSGWRVENNVLILSPKRS
ncbi:TIGR02281 family clan AA aspartic protease [Novosphingobium umbonatum]|uniref:TIGR02281 family clan AA aspartic protease n=2 Tax=Novosphingobium umbonatum TaxID=1908524 RepID=A0A3S2VUU8_9SPHN|nr:TIGR02281 family clan AA aspartic protease [Novosphingobium umbonatum]